MGDQIKGVSQDFEIAAVPLAEQVLVPLDKDIADWRTASCTSSLAGRDVSRRRPRLASPPG
jgi:hypothetical protein